MLLRDIREQQASCLAFNVAAETTSTARDLTQFWSSDLFRLRIDVCILTAARVLRDQISEHSSNADSPTANKVRCSRLFKVMSGMCTVLMTCTPLERNAWVSNSTVATLVPRLNCRCPARIHHPALTPTALVRAPLTSQSHGTRRATLEEVAFSLFSLSRRPSSQVRDSSANSRT